MEKRYRSYSSRCKLAALHCSVVFALVAVCVANSLRSEVPIESRNIKPIARGCIQRYNSSSILVATPVAGQLPPLADVCIRVCVGATAGNNNIMRAHSRGGNDRERSF